MVRQMGRGWPSQRRWPYSQSNGANSAFYSDWSTTKLRTIRIFAVLIMAGFTYIEPGFLYTDNMEAEALWIRGY